VPRGGLLWADLGDFALDRFAERDQQGVYWLSLWQPGTVLLTPEGQRLDLVAQGLRTKIGKLRAMRQGSLVTCRRWTLPHIVSPSIPNR
jgi:hypothetical protein